MSNSAVVFSVTFNTFTINDGVWKITVYQKDFSYFARIADLRTGVENVGQTELEDDPSKALVEACNLIFDKYQDEIKFSDWTVLP